MGLSEFNAANKGTLSQARLFWRMLGRISALYALQVNSNVERILVPQLAVLLKRLVDDFF